MCAIASLVFVELLVSATSLALLKKHFQFVMNVLVFLVLEFVGTPLKKIFSLWLVHSFFLSNFRWTSFLESPSIRSERMEGTHPIYDKRRVVYIKLLCDLGQFAALI